MYIKKKLIIATLILAISGALVAGSSRVYAEQANSEPFSTLVQRIADKFKLNKSDVQGVFDQYKTEKETEMRNRHEEFLTQAVTDGKITQTQKQLILSKWQELRTNRSERKTAMNGERQSLSDWAKQNNIDPEYLHPGGMWHFRGMR